MKNNLLLLSLVCISVSVCGQAKNDSVKNRNSFEVVISPNISYPIYDQKNIKPGIFCNFHLSWDYRINSEYTFQINLGSNNNKYFVPQEKGIYPNYYNADTSVIYNFLSLGVSLIANFVNTNKQCHSIVLNPSLDYLLYNTSFSHHFSNNQFLLRISAGYRFERYLTKKLSIIIMPAASYMVTPLLHSYVTIDCETIKEYKRIFGTEIGFGLRYFL